MGLKAPEVARSLTVDGSRRGRTSGPAGKGREAACYGHNLVVRDRDPRDPDPDSVMCLLSVSAVMRAHVYRVHVRRDESCSV
jgi:hypothetical protein